MGQQKQKGSGHRRNKNHGGRRSAGVKRVRTKDRATPTLITSSTLYPGVYWKGVIQ